MTFLLSLLGIGKSLLSWLSAGFKWIFASGERVIIAALLAACLWLYVDKASETRRADKAVATSAKWKRTAEQEIAAHATTKLVYKKAQQEAAELNRRQVAEYEERERNHAITTDKTIRNNVNLALAGLRARQAAQSHSNGTRNAQAPATSSDTSGTGGVSIVDAGNAGNEDDVRICTENTVKLIGAREYLLTLPE